MSPPRVLVVQNTARGGPKRLGDWLESDGLELETVAPFNDTLLPATLGHDAVIVLGGGFMPDDDARAPWLPATRSLVSQALDRHRPVLGICLGGQLLAHVAGGTVHADTGTPEHGSTPIRFRDEARDDPLFHDLPPAVPAVEHHVDAITALPPGAVWLASSTDVAYQAFRLGRTAWGVQFHPEASAETILNWDAQGLRQHGLDRQRLYERALAVEPRSADTWRTVAHRFAQAVHGHTDSDLGNGTVLTTD